MDLEKAFLHGDLDKSKNMEEPAGFEDPSQPDLMGKLKKAEAPRLWHAKIDSFLIGELSFIGSRNDPCLYDADCNVRR